MDSKGKNKAVSSDKLEDRPEDLSTIFCAMSNRRTWMRGSSRNASL